MINLFESYTTDTKDLHQSLKNAGYDFQTVVLNDSGFLPEGIISPYGYFLNYQHEPNAKGCYFNEIKIPDFWEIRSNNVVGEIVENDIKKATIHYREPTHQRIVDRVDWLDRHGQLLFVEHYNQYGKVFAKTYYHGKPSPIFRTYINAKQEEVIVEHYEVGTVILNKAQSVEVFQSKFEFYHYFFKEAKLDTTGFILNSLSVPFLFTYQMDKSGCDILFWQEPIANEIPGNMQIILNGNERVRKVIVQQKEAYDKLYQLANETQREKIEQLGYIYHFHNEPSIHHEVLTLTNSDNLACVKELVEQLPQVTFHIGAITEMSDKLMAMAVYDNVKLYPNIRLKTVDKLFKTCAVYLDINYENEILNAIRTAFEHNQVILSFEETTHQRKFTAIQHRYTLNHVDQLVEMIQQIFNHSDIQLQALHNQQKHALQETTQTYHDKLQQWIDGE